VRFAIEKLHNWTTTPKTKFVEIRPLIDGECVPSALDPMMAQIHRLKHVHKHSTGVRIHQNAADWLREAIDDKIAKDQSAPPHNPFAECVQSTAK
jgi:hypothetical protein